MIYANRKYLLNETQVIYKKRERREVMAKKYKHIEETSNVKERK